MTVMTRILGDSNRDGAYEPVMRWVLLAALMCLSAVILWDYGLLQYLFSADTSRISFVIATLFLGFAAHSLWILLWMAREYRQALVASEVLGQSSGALTVEAGQILVLTGKLAPQGIVSDYFRTAATSLTEPDGDRQLLLQSVAATLRRRTKVGVYGADLLYKLGMLGTMVGFVIMLNSMGDLTSFEVEALRSALQKMISGMAVSLLTTIAGLVGGILLRPLYNLTEGLSTDIIQTMVKLTETELVPRMKPSVAHHV